jgi:hypothetical protein
LIALHFTEKGENGEGLVACLVVNQFNYKVGNLSVGVAGNIREKFQALGVMMLPIVFAISNLGVSV